MVALVDLQPASFRGAAFLCPHDHVKEGRNTIDHKYPNSSYRYAEDNGYTPPEFDMTCVLHGPNLLADFSRLRAALNTPGPGTLRHPWYGAQFCAVKGPWKVSREDRDSGVLELDVTFLVTGPPAFPGLVSNIAATISTLSASAVAASFAAFTAQFNLPRSPFSQAYIANLMRNTTTVVHAQFPRTADVASAINVVLNGPPTG